MAAYTFYTNPMSRGQIARWALHEVGADYEAAIVDLTDKSKALLGINPMGKVPTIVHHAAGGDRVVTEAAAICHYLAEMHTESGLLPNDAEKADYYRWLFFAAGPVEQATTSSMLGIDVPDDKKGTVGFGSLDRTVDALDDWLSSHDHVCGARFTMADVYVGSQVDWGLTFGMLPDRTAFQAYADRLRGRDAYQAAKRIDNALIAELQGN